MSEMKRKDAKEHSTAYKVGGLGLETLWRVSKNFLCLGSASLFGGELSFFVFSRVVPFPPAAMKSFEIYLRFRVFTSTAKIAHTKYNLKRVKFSFS